MAEFENIRNLFVWEENLVLELKKVLRTVRTVQPIMGKKDVLWWTPAILTCVGGMYALLAMLYGFGYED